MALDTRSGDRLGDLEKRLDAHIALTESNCARLDQNTAAIADLKVSMMQIDASLKEIAASMASHGQGDFTSS